MRFTAFTSLTALFESFAHRAAPISVAGLWQGLAIALALTLCLKIARRVSAAQRFVVWFGGFVAVATLPLLPLAFEAFRTSRTSGFAAPAASPHVWLQFDVRWTYAIAALWLVASTVRAVDLIFHVIRLRGLLRTAIAIEVPALPRSQRAFEVCATQFLDRPSVIGFFAPRVLIPDWLLARLSPDELQQIVLHESVHLTRRDDWSNLLQKLCLVLFPLNPALWVIDRQLAREREMACDEAVVHITQAPRAYAACLTSLAERGLAYRKEALSLGAWQHRSELVSRVHRILRAHHGLSPLAARLLLGTVGCSLLLLTFELVRCPQLVAFVPAAETARPVPALAHLSAQQGDAVYPTNPLRDRLTQGARIVQTRAEIPAALTLKPLASRAHLKTRAKGELRAASSEPGIDLPDRRAPAQHELVASPSKTGTPQQLIVFTTWEQIETTTPASQTVAADYDRQPVAVSNTSSQVPAAATTENGAKATRTKPPQGSPQRRTTVTQLILRVTPSSSKSKQPMAIPIGDGWFVIQL